jgi:hypothetical protein
MAGGREKEGTGRQVDIKEALEKLFQLITLSSRFHSNIPKLEKYVQVYPKGSCAWYHKT